LKGGRLAPPSYFPANGAAQIEDDALNVERIQITGPVDKSLVGWVAGMAIQPTFGPLP